MGQDRRQFHVVALGEGHRQERTPSCLLNTLTQIKGFMVELGERKSRNGRRAGRKEEERSEGNPREGTGIEDRSK